VNTLCLWRTNLVSAPEDGSKSVVTSRVSRNTKGVERPIPAAPPQLAFARTPADGASTGGRRWCTAGQWSP
jgi:hypothetical protein